MSINSDDLKSHLHGKNFVVSVNTGEKTQLHFHINKFYTRKEKYTDDTLLYIEPQIDTPHLELSFKIRVTIEREVEKYLKKVDPEAKEIEQVIIPFAQFWNDPLIESTEIDAEYGQELGDFIMKKVRKKMFRIVSGHAKILFKIHPYKIHDGKLLFDMRSFLLIDPSGRKRDISYEKFEELISSTVRKSLRHLVPDVQLVDHKVAPSILSESQTYKLRFINDKEVTDCVTKVGILSFKIEPIKINNDLLLFSVKHFTCYRDGQLTHEVKRDMVPTISIIVRNEVFKYGIYRVEYLNQRKTLQEQIFINESKLINEILNEKRDI